MKRIIIVDDDPGIQYAFTVIFDPKLYEVIVYPNGKSVLTNQYPIPDLFILDKQLSGVDGLDICRFLKSQPQTSHIPVIMLSASPNIHMYAREAGADDALEKPFSVQVFRDLADKYLK
jgi:DNA-binding response OmpR family regulator